MKDKNTTVSINQEEIYGYLKDIRKFKVMTPERERELSEVMNSGIANKEQIDDIKKELLEGNLRFVISVAKQYQNQGLELGDLIAEGNLGLIKAIDSFDWTKKLRFISYAVWWIRQSVIQSLNEKSRSIRIPVNVIQDLQKEKKKSEKTGDNLSDRFSSLPSIVKLDMNINEDGDSLIDVIVNPNALSPDSGFSTQDTLKQKLFDVMNILDEREKVIIDDYFGLSGSTRTLEEIGNDFNLTKERIRQIKERALRKLRNQSSELFEYM
jgi:RNA polymerase primary sigma factor